MQMITLLLNATLVLVGGYAAGKLAERLRLPALLGMMIFGILIGPSVLGLLSQEFLSLSPTVSLLALMVVITSSFFAIDIEVLRHNIKTVGLVATIPGLTDGFAILVMAPVATIAIELTYRKLLVQAAPSTVAAEPADS